MQEQCFEYSSLNVNIFKGKIFWEFWAILINSSKICTCKIA